MPKKFFTESWFSMKVLSKQEEMFVSVSEFRVLQVLRIVLQEWKFWENFPRNSSISGNFALWKRKAFQKDAFLKIFTHFRKFLPQWPASLV